MISLYSLVRAYGYSCGSKDIPSREDKLEDRLEKHAALYIAQSQRVESHRRLPGHLGRRNGESRYRENDLRAIGRPTRPGRRDYSGIAGSDGSCRGLARIHPVEASLIRLSFFFFFQVTRRASRDEPFYDENGRLISDSPIVSRLYPVTDDAKSREILSVSGCGDCLAAGIIRGIHANLSESECISLGLKTAALSLKSFDAVPRTLMDLSNDNRL